ncbi:hypothetical protein FA15DRAFT_86427 [Coprinopsis marcescibilis]|uniref:Uncharacterized protein n=1 Tax=Coprinopsis marcescibilis TaxID=230819 RepID=A0A5C3L6A6_COPMA|nr:hypothetical protein FA15DRAFT_86427 [Coprinopsis marcescibilis]
MAIGPCLLAKSTLQTIFVALYVSINGARVPSLTYGFRNDTLRVAYSISPGNNHATPRITTCVHHNVYVTVGCFFPFQPMRFIFRKGFLTCGALVTKNHLSISP